MQESFSLLPWLTAERDRGTIVWLCNIGAEQFWHRQSKGIVDREENRVVGRIEEMNLLLCRRQDVLILREQPDAAFLSDLAGLGFDIPRIWIPGQTDAETPISMLVLKDEQLLRKLEELRDESEEVYFVPYAVTMLEEEIAQRSGLMLAGPSSALGARVNDKIFNRQMAEELGFPVCQGAICGTVEELRTQYRALKQTCSQVIVKEPYSASGKGLYLIDSDERFHALCNRLSRIAGRSGHPEHPWIIEQWLDKRADVNIQLFVNTDGSVDVFSIKQQMLNGTVYIGSLTPPRLEPAAMQRLQDYGVRIGAYLHGIGYSGVAGVDAIITRDDVIIPIIEINGRFTLSTYLSFVQRIFAGKKLYSRYFRLVTDHAVDYTALRQILAQDGLLYEQGGEGIFVYTSGTLPSISLSGEQRYMGRVFALIIADEWETAEQLENRLEQTLRRLYAQTLPGSPAGGAAFAHTQ